MPGLLNGRNHYVSEDHYGVYSIWYCGKKWMIGPTEEKNQQCQGYAYIKTNSTCLPCTSDFGWRVLQIASKWELLVKGSMKVKCNYEGNKNIKNQDNFQFHNDFNLKMKHFRKTYVLFISMCFQIMWML